MRHPEPSDLASENPRALAMRRIRQWLDDGTWTPGEHLPSARALARKLDMNPKTVQRAVAELKRQGLLVPARKGTRALTPASRSGTDLLADTIVVLTTHSGSDDATRASGWLDRVTTGVVHGIEQLGKNALIVNEGMHAEFRGRVLAHRPFGIVIDASRAPSDGDILDAIQDAGVPTVAFGDEPELRRFDRVTPDQKQGGSDLVRWLAENGRKRIVQVWSNPPTRAWEKERRAGYARGARDARVAAVEEIRIDRWPEHYKKESWDADVRSVAGYFVEIMNSKTPPNAILTPSDRSIFGIASALRVFGKRPNRDVALVGYDNYWADCPEREIEDVAPLVTVDKHNLEMGQEMVRLLLARAEGALPAKPQLRTVPSDVVPVDAAHRRRL